MRASPQPTSASLLCQLRRSKDSHCPHFGLRLVPDWLLEGDVASYRQKLKCITCIPSTSVSLVGGRFRTAERNGSARPTRSMRGRRIARLPCPPLHFMSRVVSVDSAPETQTGELSAWWRSIASRRGVVFPGEWSACAADTRPHGDGDRPSGWMSAYSGITVEGESELFFRNIDRSPKACASMFRRPYRRLLLAQHCWTARAAARPR